MSNVDDMVKFEGRARVTLTIEMDLGDTWGGDCSVAQIQKQAAEAAIGHVRHGLIVHGLTGRRDATQHARLVGEPKVEAILMERKRG